MAPDVADKFEDWRRARSDGQRRRAVAPASSELAKLTNNLEANWTPAYEERKYKPKTIASLDAYTRQTYSGFSIKAPNRATQDEPFVATVEIKNSSKQAASVTIGMHVPSIDERHSDGESVTIEGPPGAIELAPGETRKVEFKVSARHTGTLALAATVECDDCKLPYKAPAFEAVDIVAARPSVARR